MANGTFGGGTGTELDPYLVEDAMDLDAVRNNLDAYYKQTKDIDLSGISHVPIGSYADGIYFNGGYDGDVYKIKNYTVSGPSASGIFGATGDAIIKNVTTENVIVGECEYASALIGFMGNSTDVIIENCKVFGIEALNFGGWAIGGLVAYAEGAGNITFKNCEVWDMNVTCECDTGGILGDAWYDWSGEDKVLTHRFEKCRVVNISVVSDSNVGGLVAYGEYVEIEHCSVENANLEALDYGNVSCLTGFCYRANVKNAFGTGSIKNNYTLPQRGYSGGLICWVGEACTVENVYFEGTITTIIDGCGAIIGSLENEHVTVKNAFSYVQGNPTYDFVYLEETGYYDDKINTGTFDLVDCYSLYTNSGIMQGQLINNEELIQKKSTYEAAGWDFNNVWKINEGSSLPYLFGGKSIGYLEAMPLTSITVVN
ncbi:GLUG motif-containing protein [Lysinibacillus sp. KU-BSD001]|uniref:GLUG motif-containing protein n=1 Tax=Lysinibacillus sp. KU-BSD001 TaxID=3141328 RepID=UPI0036EAECF7